MIYFGLIVISFSVYSILYSEAFVSLSTSSNFSYSIALSSLTQINGDAFHPGLSGAFLLFSLIITQISGIALLSYLLWFYWKLFGDRGEKRYSIIRAFKLTILISFISELILFLFFLYAIPVELTDFSIQKKSLAALSLSINSFNNAGFTHIYQFFDQGVLEQNFILQIGILGGSIIGSLGIFVIYELFSPLKTVHSRFARNLLCICLIRGHTNKMASIGGSWLAPIGTRHTATETALTWLSLNSGMVACE